MTPISLTPKLLALVLEKPKVFSANLYVEMSLYIMVDVCNYSMTYKVCGHTNHMSPDDHFQDLKRIIAAVGGKARRVNVIMPFLYESRQHKRTGRESLSCALATLGSLQIWG